MPAIPNRPDANRRVIAIVLAAVATLIILTVVAVPLLNARAERERLDNLAAEFDEDRLDTRIAAQVLVRERNLPDQVADGLAGLGDDLGGLTPDDPDELFLRLGEIDDSTSSGAKDWIDDLYRLAHVVDDERDDEDLPTDEDLMAVAEALTTHGLSDQELRTGLAEHLRVLLEDGSVSADEAARQMGRLLNLLEADGVVVGPWDGG